MIIATTKVLAAIILLTAAVAPAADAATITLNPFSAPGEGFNDPTPVAPIGLNAGTTAGEQRRIAVQRAIDIWAAALDSSVEIVVEASFSNLACSESSATLAAAGPLTVHRDYFNAPVPLTWYSQALANKFVGFDLAPSDSDIGILLNSSIDDGCAFPASWYYGLDANPGAGEIDLVTVALHELAHGLGFLSLVDLDTGQKLVDFDDVYSLLLENHSGCRLYPPMSDKERREASVDTGDLHWTGDHVIVEGAFLTAGRHPESHVEIYAPDPTRPGSSVSHFSTTLSPNELMEPSYTGPNHDIGLTVALLNDLGWGGEFPKSANPACNDGEFRVNTQGIGDQRSPDVAVSAEGNIFVTWVSEGISNAFIGDVEGQDGDGAGIYGQMYSSSGAPLGSEFRINEETAGNQYEPEVTASASGTFMAVWHGPDGDSDGVLAQRYDSQGNPIGGNFVVNSYTQGSQGFKPRIDSNSAGDIVVVWRDGTGHDGDGYGVFGQRFDSAGSPLGTEFQVNTFTTSNQGWNGLDVTVDEAGGFVVVWHSQQQDSAQIGLAFDGGVFGQRFASDGSLVGSEFQVNTYTLNDQGFFGLSADTDAAGNFVVTWQSVKDDGHTTNFVPYGGIFGQRYASDGSPLGGEFQINAESKNLQDGNTVVVAPSGEFLVVWQSFVKDGGGGVLEHVSNDLDVKARLFDATGNGVGEEFRVNAFLPGDQREAAAALDTAGNLVILFHSSYCDGSDERLCRASPDGMGEGVYGQRLSLQTPACEPAPLASCSSAAKSTIIMKQGGSKKLTWKWLKGSPLDTGDLGQPAAGITNFAVCVYQDGVTPTLVMAAALPAGGTCGNKPCWKNIGSKGKGYRFKDRDAASDGFSKVLLKTGGEGRSKIIIKGSGPSLPLPALPLASYEGLVVQLVSGDGHCWESRFAAPAKKNDSSKFLER